MIKCFRMKIIHFALSWNYTSKYMNRQQSDHINVPNVILVNLKYCLISLPNWINIINFDWSITCIHFLNQPINPYSLNTNTSIVPYLLQFIKATGNCIPEVTKIFKPVGIVGIWRPERALPQNSHTLGTNCKMLEGSKASILLAWFLNWWSLKIQRFTSHGALWSISYSMKWPFNLEKKQVGSRKHNEGFYGTYTNHSGDHCSIFFSSLYRTLLFIMNYRPKIAMNYGL